jgi:hypothetical protein
MAGLEFKPNYVMLGSRSRTGVQHVLCENAISTALRVVNGRRRRCETQMRDQRRTSLIANSLPHVRTNSGSPTSRTFQRGQVFCILPLFLMRAADALSDGPWRIIFERSSFWTRSTWQSFDVTRQALIITQTKVRNIRRLHSVSDAKKPAFDRRWDQLATATTTRCAKASMRHSNANCSCEIDSRLYARQKRRSLISSRAGTTRIGVTRRSAICRQENSSVGWPTRPDVK